MAKSEEFKFISKTKQFKKNTFPGNKPLNLINARIIQKHLVYVIGLSSSLTNKEVIVNFPFILK